MKYWFSADYHLGHAKIIDYCNRPFKSLEQMNETIIRNHNARVKSEDTVFHIGDFCFKNTSNKGEGIRVNASTWEKKLNGKIIHIMGNHCRNNGVRTLVQSLVIKYGGRQIRLVHNPEHIDYRYNLHFVGHVHEKWKFKEVYAPPKINTFIDLINVGVDVNNFYPKTFDEIKNSFSSWKKTNEN